MHAIIVEGSVNRTSESEKVTYLDMLTLVESTLPESVYDQVLIDCLPTEMNVHVAYNMLKNNGSLEIRIADPSTIELDVQIAGFVEIIKTEGLLRCKKPNWETGVKAAIAVKPIVAAASSTPWKLDNTFAGDDDLIDEDDLLSQSVVALPDPPGACGTEASGGKKRACKDCTCGKLLVPTYLELW
jgi:hypothetical protein